MSDSEKMVETRSGRKVTFVAAPVTTVAPARKKAPAKKGKG